MGVTLTCDLFHRCRNYLPIQGCARSAKSGTALRDCALSPRGLGRAHVPVSSRSLLHGAIATATTCALSRSSRASFAAANRPTRITYATCSRPPRAAR
jgi:hypothetical protein